MFIYCDTAIVCICANVCPPPRLLIAGSALWTPYDWLKKFCIFYITAVVAVSSGYGFRIEARHRNQPGNSKL